MGAAVGLLPLDPGRVGRRTAGRGFSVNVTLGGRINLGRPVVAPEEDDSSALSLAESPLLMERPDSTGLSDEVTRLDGRDVELRKGNARLVGAPSG